MTIHQKLSYSFLSLLVCGAFLNITLTADARAENIIQDNDRIVFVGDSITGQGARGGKNGWIALIGEGLSLERPSAKPTLIGLGGSGSTVGAWMNHEKKSREKVVTLDVKEIEVGKTLDAGAEIVVFMLGMNDALSPSLKNTPKDFNNWETKYLELIDAIKVRAKPRVIALAKVTPCTEDPASPKNQVISELNKRIEKIAREKECKLLPTSESAYEMLALGRTYNPEFHVAGDMVHPSNAGHVAIAAGMLRGLGEEQAAAKLIKKYDKYYKPAPNKLPTLSYILEKTPSLPDDSMRTFTIQYFWTSAKSKAEPSIKVTVPEGWKANPGSAKGSNGKITVTGTLDRVENKITLNAISGSENAERVISIPAGWRIAFGSFKQPPGWKHGAGYNLGLDVTTPLDEEFANGKGFTEPVTFSEKSTSPWTDYVANNADYTGKTPGNVDFAGVVFSNFGNSAYAARWIKSDKDRTVTINMGCNTFANPNSMTVWLNDKSIYKGPIGKAKKASPVAVQLKKGWNLLLVKSNFYQWQWQFSIDLAGENGDDLADLRYSTKPMSK